MERAQVTDDLLGIDQKIPDQQTKITFLDKVETAIRSGIESRFSVMGFSTSDSILGLWFSVKHFKGILGADQKITQFQGNIRKDFPQSLFLQHRNLIKARHSFFPKPHQLELVCKSVINMINLEKEEVRHREKLRAITFRYSQCLRRTSVSQVLSYLPPQTDTSHIPRTTFSVTQQECFRRCKWQL